jgi:hypothetical protein
MSAVIDLGCVRAATRGTFPCSMQLDVNRIIENGIKYRASDYEPDFIKVEDPE